MWLLPVFFNDFLYNALSERASTPMETSMMLAVFLFLRLISYFAISFLFYASFAKRLQTVGLPKWLFFISFIDACFFPLLLSVICIFREDCC